MNENNIEKIKEINRHIRDGIDQWADVMLTADADQWAYRLDYFPRDLMNATLIFQHVASNIGIKAGNIDEQKAVEFGERLRRLVIDMTGVDPHDGWEQQPEEEDGDGAAGGRQGEPAAAAPGEEAGGNGGRQGEPAAAAPGEEARESDRKAAGGTCRSDPERSGEEARGERKGRQGEPAAAAPGEATGREEEGNGEAGGMVGGIAMLLCLLLCGCGTTRYVGVPEVHEHWQHTTDTVVKTDSVIEREVTTIREVDSATMAQYGVELKQAQRAWLIETDRMQRELSRLREAKRDTVVQRDSVPVPYPVEVVKTETTGWWAFWGLVVVIVAIGAIVAVRKIKRLKN